jgi:hypothetical protein
LFKYVAMDVDKCDCLNIPEALSKLFKPMRIPQRVINSEANKSTFGFREKVSRTFVFGHRFDTAIPSGSRPAFKEPLSSKLFKSNTLTSSKLACAMKARF